MIAFALALAATTATPNLDRMTDMFVVFGACERYMTDADRQRVNAYVQPAPLEWQNYLQAAKAEGRTLKLSSYQCRKLIDKIAAPSYVSSH
jgi:hypothetical protein